jgi:hypothetical protein
MPQIPDLTEPRYLDESGRFFTKKNIAAANFAASISTRNLNPA